MEKKKVEQKSEEMKRTMDGIRRRSFANISHESLLASQAWYTTKRERERKREPDRGKLYGNGG